MSSDLISQTAQGTVLSIGSNILAQVISSYKKDTPLSINLAPVIKFAAFSIISNPPNIAWQSILENAFPTHIPVRSPKSMSEKAKGKSPSSKSQISKTNVAIKFFLDQTIGAAINTILFLAFMGYVNAVQGGKEAPWEAVKRDCNEKLWPIMLDGYKLWPFVSLVSFLFIPVNRRVVVGCMVGVGWNIYLSLLVDS